MTSKRKVLISEDSKDFYAKCSPIFSVHDYETILVPKHGGKVLAAIEEHSPDVVLMEAGMAQYDAIEIIKRARQNPAARSPLFMVLAFPSQVVERQLYENGADYIFIKPVDMDIMVERIISSAESSMKNWKEPQAESLSQKKSLSPVDIEIMVTDVIHEVGVPAHIKGYHYLRDSIIMAIENPEIINAITKQLYPRVAKKNGSISSRVERAIRHAIEVAWDRGDMETLNSYFGFTVHNARGKPTNSEFIAMISDKLRLKIKSVV